MNILYILCPLIFLAGFIDPIAGGGGLISLTAYMACGISPQLALGTNKFSAVTGGTIASVNYAVTKNYDISSLAGAFFAALVGSWLGADAALLIDQRIFSVIILFITPLIAAMVLTNKSYSNHEKELSVIRKILISIAIGLIVGFYDGFYGPGTGTFMQTGFIVLVGISVKKSCGNARMVNWASNFGSLLNFIRTDNVLYEIGIPCAICSILGNYIGSKLAIKKDVKIVKPTMLIVVSLLFLKILFDLLMKK